jgi:hypothetical protein
MPRRTSQAPLPAEVGAAQPGRGTAQRGVRATRDQNNRSERGARRSETSASAKEGEAAHEQTQPYSRAPRPMPSNQPSFNRHFDPNPAAVDAELLLGDSQSLPCIVCEAGAMRRAGSLLRYAGLLAQAQKAAAAPLSEVGQAQKAAPSIAGCPAPPARPTQPPVCPRRSCRAPRPPPAGASRLTATTSSTP